MKNHDIKRIIVVDDTSSITFALGEWLRSACTHDVLTFEDPLEAVNEITQNGIPDFIVTDYNMPGMNGIEFLEKVASDKENVSAIIMTAYPSEVKFKAEEKSYDVIEKKPGFMDLIVNRIMQKN